MNAPFFISPRVVNTLNSLPEEDRLALVSTIASELVLGCKSDKELTPLQQLAYTIIRQYVVRDTNRAIAAC